MNIKTFPLHFTEDKHREIAEAAKKSNMPIKDFINIAIDKQLKKGAKQ